MEKYTVLLLYPDYIAECFGHETYLAHVEASSVEAAILAAQLEVSSSLEEDDEDLDDFFPLAVFAGHLDDLNPGGIGA